MKGKKLFFLFIHCDRWIRLPPILNATVLRSYELFHWQRITQTFTSLRNVRENHNQFFFPFVHEFRSDVVVVFVFLFVYFVNLGNATVISCSFRSHAQHVRITITTTAKEEKKKQDQQQYLEMTIFAKQNIRRRKKKFAFFLPPPPHRECECACWKGRKIWSMQTSIVCTKWDDIWKEHAIVARSTTYKCVEICIRTCP